MRGVRGLLWGALLLAAPLAAQTLPPAPASGASSVQGGAVDRWADALLLAAAEREATSLRLVHSLAVEFDGGVAFWRITPPEASAPPEASGAWPAIDCRVIGPEVYVEREVFCSSVLGFYTGGSGGGDETGDADGGIGPYEIAYHARTWGGRAAHGLTVTGARGQPLAETMDRYEMWIDAQTLTLVLMRTTGPDAPGQPPSTFAFERSDLREVKGLTIPHHYRTTLYGAAPAIVADFSDEENAALALVRDALDAPDPDAAIDALPDDVREAVGFYEAMLTNGPLEWEYTVRAVRLNRPLPSGVFGGFGR